MKSCLLLGMLVCVGTLSASVPEPRPVKSDVEITALYYPGTDQMSEWDVIAETCPERKPLLGWFDEGSPEAIDWQIKWAVEHGITSFCVDWYWNKGYRRLEHWIKGYYRAKYRGHLKWFMMYANHNQPGAHSTEDQIAVTKYWIDNYFRTPEYYTIDGKPAVCYWDAGNLDRDFIAEAAAKGETLAPGEGIRRAFAISEKLVKEAGLPGICWIDMWRTAKFDRAYAEKRREQGYSAAIHYGIECDAPKILPGVLKPGETPRRFDYDAVVAAAPKVWEEMSLQETLPYWVILPTGWDDRPRSFGNSFVITGRTPEKFAEICRQAKAFCDRHDKRHVIVMPINEWQEGSYVEPNEEYGFGMYDAIRDAFCEKPADGWPKNVRPSDVGMGPYDYPPSFRSPEPRWEFEGSTGGWYRQPYGGGELEVKDGCLHYWVNRRHNYNIRQRVKPFAAAAHGRFRLRMRITPNEKERPAAGQAYALRLKWGTDAEPIIGPGLKVDEKKCVATTPVMVDGEWHEYEIPLAAHPDWKGMVDELWFEACSLMHARVAIDWMRFESEPIRVALTFDDSLKDHLLVAAPLLEERGWRGTFNIVTDWVGKNEKSLTWDDVRELVRRGHEVTTHTVSHPHLLTLLSEWKTNEVRRQLAVSRDLIAEKTGFAPRYMCAPYIQQSAETDRLCREANLRQMNVRRHGFGGGDDGIRVRQVIAGERAKGGRRVDLLHHGVSAADHGGWHPFPDRAAFTRHLDSIAAMERAGEIVVTDYDGCASDCALKAKPWPHHGVLALSFDDRNLRDWERAFPLFARFGATATFCISGAIDTNAVAFARKALLAGHEIALHGLCHRNADLFVAANGTNAYWQAEMVPQIEACRAAGIPVRSFAYPNCRHSESSDALFAQNGFTRLRGSIPDVKSPNPYDPKGEKRDEWRPVAASDAFFDPATSQLTDRAISNIIVGESYHTDIADILRAVERAGMRGERLSLVSHGIAPNVGGISMKTEWLERILAEAGSAGVVVRGLR